MKELQRAGRSAATVYGIEELNGLGMMYVLEDSPEKYGLIPDPRISTAAHIWDYIFKPVREVVVLAMVFALWVNKSESTRE